MFYFYQILSPLNELKTISEGGLLLPNYSLQLVKGGQYLVEVEHPLIVFKLFTILLPLNKLKTISEGGLLLPNTVTL
jgi:hypothetical protein